jgi:hypothetical protein
MHYVSMWHGFSIYPFTYNVHFEPIQHVYSLCRYFPIFKINEPKVTIGLDDFPSLSKSMVQWPPIQLLQLATHFYYNENFYDASMDILKDNWDSPLEYVVSLFNNSCNKNITKNKLEIVFNIYETIWRITQMYLSMKFCLIYSFQFPLPKFKKIPKFKWNNPIWLLSLM